MPYPRLPGPLPGLLLLLLSGVLSGEVPADPCGAEPCNTRDMCRTGDCQFVVDPCENNPCNHGNCSTSGDGYLCICNDGYTGANCDLAPPDPPEFQQSAQQEPRSSTPVPKIVVPRSPVALILPTWKPRAGQKVAHLKWDEVQIVPDVACGNASSNSSTGGRLVSFDVAQNTSIKITRDVTASLILLWKVTAGGYNQCSLIDGRSVALLQAPGGLILSEEVLALGNNYFIGFVNDSISKCIVALRLTVTVKISDCDPEEGVLQCHGKGHCVTERHEDTYFCHCEAAYMGSYCEEFNACHGYPCQNNATCSDVPQRHSGKNATCTCLTGYTGQRCQSVVDHCSPQPCGNGATCESSLSGFSCQCPEGFLGSLCEEKVDPCSPTPCLNNGSCYPAGLSYACSCSPGFTGPACAKLVDFCALSPCAHGICRSVGTSYKCLCIPGYHGLYCEEEYNECASTPCQNAASCRDLVNGYECVCEGEYEGRHCELYKDPCVNISCQNGGTCDNEGLNATCVCAPGFIGEECDIDVNECDSSPCHHAGTCVDQANGYTCNCPHGWVGANCEIHLQWKAGHTAESLTNMPRHSLYIIIGALCVAFLLMLIILIVGICRISRIEYQGSSRPAYEEFYNCRSIDSEFSSAIASIRHARFGKKSRPAMYDATPVSFEDYSPDDKPLVTLIKTKDL